MGSLKKTGLYTGKRSCPSGSSLYTPLLGKDDLIGNLELNGIEPDRVEIEAEETFKITNC